MTLLWLLLSCTLHQSHGRTHAHRPPTNEQPLKLHPVVAARAKAFVDEYVVVKNPRTLEFKNDLGKVELSLESESGSVRNFSVSPVLVRACGCQHMHALARTMRVTVQTIPSSRVVLRL